MRIHTIFTLLLFQFASAGEGVQAQGDAPVLHQQSLGMTAEELDRTLVSVYEKVNPAVVRFEFRDKNRSGGSTGVIVTEEGHVLVRYVEHLSPSATITIQLADARREAAVVRGWSQEYGVTMLQLKHPGPWPHTDLTRSQNVKAGQCLVTLKFPLNDNADVIPRPLLKVTRATVASHGWWFLSSEVSNQWETQGIAFDLSNRCAGICTYVNGASSGECAYIEAALLRTIITELIAGTNLDQRRLESKQSARLEPDANSGGAKRTISQEAKDNAIAASVHIRGPAGIQMRVSGTIISEDGEIATCAHHWFKPGTKVTVSLTDGRDLEGVVTSVGFPADIGIIKILGDGPFPYVELGRSTELHADDHCLMIGYGPVKKEQRQPVVRTASIVGSPHDRWSMHVHTNAKVIGGDSGGGLFDADGKLVAVHHGDGDQNEDNTPSVAHCRVELFRKHWNELHAPFDLSITSELDRAEAWMGQIKQRARDSVVEILDGETVVALGTVASTDGRIWTKASVLPGSPTCRLPNGRKIPAVVLKTVRKSDLAILKVDGGDVSAAKLSRRTDPPTGSLVTVVTEKKQPACAFISHPAASFPAEQGILNARLKDTPDGLLVSELFSPWEMPKITLKVASQQLRSGDILLRIDDHPIPNFEALSQLLYSDDAEPIACAGDPISIVVKREKQIVNLRQVLGPPTWPRFIGESGRRSGIGKVYNLTTDVDSVLCGGPILDQHGECLGLVIAWRDRGWFNVLPASLLELEKDPMP